MPRLRAKTLLADIERTENRSILLTTQTSGASVASATPCDEDSRCERERNPFQLPSPTLFVQHKGIG